MDRNQRIEVRLSRLSDVEIAALERFTSEAAEQFNDWDVEDSIMSMLRDGLYELRLKHEIANRSKELESIAQ